MGAASCENNSLQVRWPSEPSRERWQSWARNSEQCNLDPFCKRYTPRMRTHSDQSCAHFHQRALAFVFIHSCTHACLPLPHTHACTHLHRLPEVHMPLSSLAARFNAERDISSLGVRTGGGMRWNVSVAAAIVAVTVALGVGWLVRVPYCTRLTLHLNNAVLIG